ncbi:hypothetical protein ACFQX6_12740 [Streptosporangium lutulentum]
MALHIIGQQISATVAFVVFDRIAAATGTIPSPTASSGWAENGCVHAACPGPRRPTSWTWPSGRKAG